jgi:hypothetical protein
LYGDTEIFCQLFCTTGEGFVTGCKNATFHLKRQIMNEKNQRFLYAQKNDIGQVLQHAPNPMGECCPPEVKFAHRGEVDHAWQS